MDNKAIELINLLLSRLEHISADSVWAHRASGIRGSLFKALETLEGGQTIPKFRFESLMAAAFKILEKASRERFKQNTRIGL